MTLDFDKFYIIQPKFWFFERRFKSKKGKPLPEDFEYSSGTNSKWLRVDQLRKMITNI
jgi:UDP-N-acetylglucosamine 4,6-dehydratase/5-epimerase